ncbi:hypothetical protein [Parvicella tangerina]|uniref:Uncharacterized protein n=1 Tax=Parvicella tangerina TaxID=2829795 RepID=A0A916JPJ8_9FLAO|nr:hypothetical protein [Parvicella tangerina]CAG5083084.1 hypothetical protein CRYO30217_02084 [Parvicella tangerina]
MYRLGYIDEDEGQRNSFYQFLKDDFEIILFSITDETELDSLVEEIFQSGIDMLVLDFRLDETGLVNFNADSLVDKIQERNLYYPLVILTSHEEDAMDHISNANLINGKEEMLGSKVQLFKQKLNKIVSGYQAKVMEAESELETLEEKRQNEGLDAKEEDRYVELNSYLDKTMTAKSRISRTFYSEDTNKKLDDLIEKTSEILSKIEKEK